MEGIDSMNNNSVGGNYSFDNFIEGSCNRLARSYAINISENPGDKLYNPFTIFGPVGCGKSHLLQAMCNKIRSVHPRKRVIYIYSPEFVRQFTTSILNNQKNDFMEFYTNLDVLLLDGLDNLQEKEMTQKVLAEIFENLIREKCQVVCAGCRIPSNDNGYIQRFISQIGSGIFAYIDKPNYETRFEILKQKCQDLEFRIDEQFLYYIAHEKFTDVRTLERALISIVTKANLIKKDITIDLVDSIIAKFF